MKHTFGTLNKYEIIGIAVSIIAMALALAYFRFEAAPAETPELTTQTDTSEDAVRVSSEGTNSESALAEALASAASTDGTLERLVINDVVIGSGDTVENGDTVRVHYTGVTRDGVQFDSSHERGAPFTFTVGAGTVIEGWEKGLIDMRVGGQRVLVIPADMAYGNRQVGPIPPNSPLVFIVELLAIE